MPIIEISSLTHPGVDVFCMLTEAQLRQRIELGKGVFIAESPNVISRALDAGYEPLALMCERKHISGSAAHIIKRCGDVPVYTGDREVLKPYGKRRRSCQISRSASRRPFWHRRPLPVCRPV